jgi:MATE family multidrug resistance protein
MIPFIFFFTFKQFFDGIGNTRIAMKITLTANAVNIVFNYLFIYGKLGFPELGLTGAGVGTFISRMIMPVLFMMVIAGRSRYRRYLVLAHHQQIRLADIKKVLKIGIPIAFQHIVEMTAFSIGAVMMGWLGEVPLAAHQVAIGLASSTYMISVGIAAASTIRVSHQIGTRDFVSMRKAAYASSHLALLFMSLMGLVFIFFRHQLPLIFNTDEQVIEIAARLLIVAAFFQVFDGLQVVMLGNLRGMADVKIPMIMAFFAYLGVGLPASYIFAFPLQLGPQGIWYGFLIGLGIAGTFFLLRFKRNLKAFSQMKM